MPKTLIQIFERDKLLKGDSDYESLHSAHGYLPSMDGRNIDRCKELLLSLFAILLLEFTYQ